MVQKITFNSGANVFGRRQNNNIGYNANIAAIERNRRQEEANRRNRENNQRLLQQQEEARQRQSRERERIRLQKQLSDQQKRNRQFQQQLSYQQRLAEQQRQFRQQQEQHRKSFARHFFDLAWKTRNIKPWQWGVAAGGTVFVLGLGNIELAALGTTGEATLGVEAIPILNQINNPTDRKIIARAIQIGQGLPNFMDKVGALAQGLKIVTGNANYKVTYDNVLNAAYLLKTGYGIALIENITYIVRVQGGRIVENLGQFPGK